MTKNPVNNVVGDTQSPALLPNASALCQAADQTQQIAAISVDSHHPVSPWIARSQQFNNTLNSSTSASSCLQKLWFSFFFDGTGNNLKAAEGTLKHSNVARLFRAHTDNDKIHGIYRVYIPGVGTYFPEIGDNGLSPLGLGSGAKGEDRLQWALAQFDTNMTIHLARANNPDNRIVEINLAAFGFSRGAALARAFINRLIQKRCHVQDGALFFKQMHIPVRIRFMGLFDTVASVGLPLATNTTAAASIKLGAKYAMNVRLNDGTTLLTRPDKLAFSHQGHAGADPVPGVYNGHASWGGELRISPLVEQVRHFVAGHEMRNSFPLDSISIVDQGIMFKPAHFFETVYPGVHSDVGGSYRPGEGGKSEKSNLKIGLISLVDMYQFALESGVPFLTRKGGWKDFNVSDFAIDNQVIDSFNYYNSKIQGNTLGSLFNAHMALYFAWRFYVIRRKQQGDQKELAQVQKSAARFAAEEKALTAQIKQLDAENSQAQTELKVAERARERKDKEIGASPSRQTWLAPYDNVILEARLKSEKAQDALLSAQARLSALPKQGSLASNLALYDEQLLEDVKSIYERMHAAGRESKSTSIANSGNLRPHYRALITAYENEFIHNKGLQDEKLIDFFDSYVHDSLAGFAKDATLPSDPRVIFVGGDEKLKYAEQPSNDTTVKTA